ncbi:MAG TPA: hypothetical protein DCY13_22385, partial [Verrucomicrobiales bacterium]|nr:hypothetical protein [Verrucomicrobiales bacterium]
AAINCTIVENHAGDDGGGMFFGTAKNCIIYFNTAGGSGADHDSTTVTYSCSRNTSPGSGNLGVNPQFVNRFGGDYRLSSTSACINRGNNPDVMGSTDVAGNPRIIYDTVDMGALEFFGAVHYVSPSGSHTFPYLTWADAANNIQAAVDAAPEGTTVLVNDGVYATGGRAFNGFALPNRVAIEKALMVQSVNGPEATIIQGAGPIGPSAVRCVYLGDNAVLSGFTLTNGAALATGIYFPDQSAGGVYCESSAVVTNCTLTGNSGNSAGGAYQGTLNNCTLTGNWALAWGGGARASTLNDCILSQNYAELQGGGAFQGTLNRCTLTGNEAGNEGGGAIFAELNHCILAGNSTGLLGGGADSCTLNNCTLSLNWLTVIDGDGGGASRSTLNNCTVTG